MKIAIAMLLLSLAVMCYADGKKAPVELKPLPKPEEVTTDDEGNELFEGDMIVSKEHKEGADRNAIIGDRYRWPKVGRFVEVPYVFTSSMSSKARAMVQEAIDDYEKWTCVKFVPRRSQKDYISFFKGNGCYSMVGKMGGKQQLSIGQNCDTRRGIVAHEMMHALGFFHEQSRSDRDQFVRIDMSKVKSQFKHNFDKCGSSCKNPPYDYDYESVMHYESYAFANQQGATTIYPLKKLPAGLEDIGQRNGIDEMDAKKINNMYGCGSTTVKSHAGLTIPSREESDKYSNCCQLRQYCNKYNPHIVKGCPVACSSKPKC